jgi:hypothetical protein
MDSNYIFQRPKNIFTAAMLGISIFIGAFIPFFSQISKDVPIISLAFGQVALVFLFLLVAFPRANYQNIVKLSIVYLSFIGFCFIFLSFLPVDPDYKIFAWYSLPDSVIVDIPALIFLNICSFLYMSLGFYIQKPVISDGTVAFPSAANAGESYTAKFQENMNEIFHGTQAPNSELPSQQYGSVLEAKESLKNEVESLFSVYDEEGFDYDGDEKSEKLNQVEEVLVKYLDPSVEEALCLDKDGKILNNTVFRWYDIEPEEVINLFKRQNNNSQNLNTGRLCQVLINSKNKWYIIAKFKANYLALKTSLEDPAPLLQTAFKVFRSL